MQVTGLSIQGKENSLSNLTSAPRALSQRNSYRDGASTRRCPSKLLCIPSNIIPSLKKIEIIYCHLTTFQGNKEGISGFISLEELRIVGCDELISSLVHEDEIYDQANGRWLLPCSLGVLDIRDASLGTLQPCFPGDLTQSHSTKSVGYLCIEISTAAFLHSTVKTRNWILQIARRTRGLPIPPRSQVFESIRMHKLTSMFEESINAGLWAVPSIGKASDRWPVFSYHAILRAPHLSPMPTARERLWR